ncbi:MAG: hypothetical protein IJF88_09085 [Oscillospiraceae bacterium]|nr:hypothetical protein [Oscillospiraceae bacterium]
MKFLLFQLFYGISALHLGQLTGFLQGQQYGALVRIKELVILLFGDPSVAFHGP